MANMTDEMKAAQYTKDRCPCHRCKKIVAELETKIAELNKQNFRAVEESCQQNKKMVDLLTQVGDRDATILRLREFIEQLASESCMDGEDAMCGSCAENIKRRYDAFKQEIEVK